MKKNDSHYSIETPNLFSLILEVILVLFVGILWGSLLLVYRDVQEVKSYPESPEPEVVYFRKPVASSTERDVVNKMMQLRGNPGPVVEVSEGEINRKLLGTFERLPVMEEEQREEETAFSRIEVGPPAVRLEKGNLEMVVVLRNSFLKRAVKDTPVQISGTFSVNEGTFQYIPKTLYVGALPVHRLPFLEEMVRGKVVNAFKSSEFFEEMKGIMKEAEKVEIDEEGDKLLFHFKSRSS